MRVHVWVSVSYVISNKFVHKHRTPRIQRMVQHVLRATQNKYFHSFLHSLASPAFPVAIMCVCVCVFCLFFIFLHTFFQQHILFNLFILHSFFFLSLSVVLCWCPQQHETTVKYYSLPRNGT